jgi:hypothetical protein
MHCAPLWAEYSMLKAQKNGATACTVCKSPRVRLVSETRLTRTYVCADCGWLRSILAGVARPGEGTK